MTAKSEQKKPGKNGQKPEDPYLIEDLKAYMLEIYEKENDEMAEKVADKVYARLAEVINPWHELLEKILSRQEELNEFFNKLLKRVDVIDNPQNGRLVILEEKVARFEKYPNASKIILWIIIGCITVFSLFLTFHKFWL
jgi:hypothetical protein